MAEPEWLPGGCHCGRVRFRVRVRERRALDCNCSICAKKGFLHLIVPPRDFELTAGADSLVEYTFNTKTARHRFCRICGVHPFYTPRSHPDHVDVNVRCLDEDHVTSFHLEPFDGQRWEENITTIK